jgi:hypothetical protein
MQPTKVDTEGFGTSLTWYFGDRVYNWLQTRMVEPKEGVDGIVSGVSGASLHSAMFTTTTGEYGIERKSSVEKGGHESFLISHRRREEVPPKSMYVIFFNGFIRGAP